MRILSSTNTIEDTDILNSTVHYSVLSFRDHKNPDFYMESLRCIDEVESSAISLEIGPYRLVMPFSWNVVITDFDILECIPLSDVIGKTFPVFCMNPIDGYLANFYPMRTGTFFKTTKWTAPPPADKDMLVIPLGFEEKRQRFDRNGKPVELGPICAIFSPSKVEMNKQIADIW